MSVGLKDLHARSRPLLSEASRFVGFGVVSYGLGLGLSALFREVIGLHEKVAVALTLAILLIFNFWLSRRFVFRSNGNARNQFVLFVGTSFVMRLGEYGLFYTLLELLSLHYLVALTLAMMISSCMKFLIYRIFVFRGATPSSS